MKNNTITIKAQLPGNISNTEILAAELLKAHLFGMPYAEQKRILGNILTISDNNPTTYTVNVDRLIALLSEITTLSVAEMDEWLSDSTLPSSLIQSIKKSKDAILTNNFASLKNSPNPYLMRVLIDLYKKLA